MRPWQLRPPHPRPHESTGYLDRDLPDQPASDPDPDFVGSVADGMRQFEIEFVTAGDRIGAEDVDRFWRRAIYRSAELFRMRHVRHEDLYGAGLDPGSADDVDTVGDGDQAWDGGSGRHDADPGGRAQRLSVPSNFDRDIARAE